MHKRLGEVIRAFSLACVASLAATAPATAAVYTGQWDPAYGAPFNDAPALGWKGSAVFVVDDGCLALGQPVDPISCPSFDVSSAQVVFYDDSLVSKPTVATLNFDAATINIFEASFLAGELEWVDSGFSDPLNPPETFQQINDYKFFLQFTPTGARLYHTLVSGGVNNPANCINQPVDVCGYSGDPVEIDFQRVPEPGSLALVLAALGAGWAVRRRV